MTPPEVRLAREKERELKELERATRTVFAFNLNIKADERDIFEFFSKAGEVRLLLLLLQFVSRLRHPLALHQGGMGAAAAVARSCHARPAYDSLCA